MGNESGAGMLTARELAERWNMPVQALSQWRWAKKGPRYFKIGGRIRYRLADVETFEAEALHETSGRVA